MKQQISGMVSHFYFFFTFSLALALLQLLFSPINVMYTFSEMGQTARMSKFGQSLFLIYIFYIQIIYCCANWMFRMGETLPLGLSVPLRLVCANSLDGIYWTKNRINIVQSVGKSTRYWIYQNLLKYLQQRFGFIMCALGILQDRNSPKRLEVCSGLITLKDQRFSFWNFQSCLKQTMILQFACQEGVVVVAVDQQLVSTLPVFNLYIVLHYKSVSEYLKPLCSLNVCVVDYRCSSVQQEGFRWHHIFTQCQSIWQCSLSVRGLQQTWNTSFQCKHHDYE